MPLHIAIRIVLICMTNYTSNDLLVTLFFYQKEIIFYPDKNARVKNYNKYVVLLRM
ncbi:uncharacterized protein BX663DRAFT_516244 [Cokeromyces recurvatus]|uniref:uncharacterized protein n=1 Tax=Cokeromyces recurvatus TaxID=90255 RepID=UPI00221EA8E2|nr:uncharacterized protein BX663DRAFT_516244 [Cokeromyces recurvatus]KAI7901076.1 hypothetical protein BX663DRAFT_516244 [Cokeromyces recurvatus]